MSVFLSVTTKGDSNRFNGTIVPVYRSSKWTAVVAKGSDDAIP